MSVRLQRLLARVLTFLPPLHLHLHPASRLLPNVAPQHTRPRIPPCFDLEETLSNMESKLQSLKVAELKQLLTAAGLAVSGNKPDLIQRLLENPQATASLGGQEAAPALASTATPATPVPAAATPTPAPAPAPAPATAPPTSDHDTSSTPAPAADPSEEDRRQALIAELEKRKARAAKFGQPLGEAERKLERAIKFGLDPKEEAAVSKLTKPLSTPADRRKEKKESGAKKEGNKEGNKEAVKEETEEEKEKRLKAVEEEKEKARRRAERFGLSTGDGKHGEKRKREEGANGGAGEKKVKA